MSTLLLVISIIYRGVSDNPDSCDSFNPDDMPLGIKQFDQMFDVEDNDELQSLANKVIANRCNFGAPKLSSSIFSFAPGYINLHCGAFGAQPKYVIKYHDHIRNVLYSRPHLWDDVYAVSIMDTLRSEMANYLGIPDKDDLVFTINTSHGINAVIRSVMDQFLAKHQNQDLTDYSVIYFNTGHPAFVAPLKYYQKLYNINLIEINFDDNIIKEYDLIIQTINNTLIDMDDTDREKTIFCVFSHVTSLPSMLLPLKEIVDLFHQYNILSIIDGAHSMGQILNINITESNCDFYVGNAYKWFYSVWNTAIIYVKKEYHDIVSPLAIAYYKNATYKKLFHHPGSVDESAYLSLMGSLEFRYLIGGEENIINYYHNLAIETQNYLADLWNTTVFLPNEAYFSSMVNIELPTIDGVELNKSIIDEIFYSILQQNDIAIKLFEWNQKFYIRISCNIYTNMEQIQQIGNLILEYMDKYKSDNNDNDDILKSEL